MEQSQTASDTVEVGHGASRRVSRGIMRALEQQKLAPGQRLIESELAAQYGVGRNAVREAIQWLSAHGMIDVTRYRSAAIARLDGEDTIAALDVARRLFALMARAAAEHFDAARDDTPLKAAMDEVEKADDAHAPGSFSRARRHLLRTLLDIGGSRELQRLFPALGIHIVYAQYRQAGAQKQRLEDFRELTAAVAAGQVDRAQRAAKAHIDRLRAAVVPA